MRQLTIPEYGAIISTVAIVLTCGSLYFSARQYDLSAAKEHRELTDKMPAIDVQLNPAGDTSASVSIAITNRADINITPLDITVEHSIENVIELGSTRIDSSKGHRQVEGIGGRSDGWKRRQVHARN
jgi:hypothetical protein